MNDTIRLLITSTCALCIAFGNASAEPSPESVVQAQVEAYNARDIDAFLATYRDDVQLFEFPDKPLSKGTSEMRASYEKLFTDPRLHAEIVKRITLGNTVIDHERVRLTLPAGPATVEAIAIYEVREGKIASVWFRYGERKLEPAAGGR